MEHPAQYICPICGKPAEFTHNSDYVRNGVSFRCCSEKITCHDCHISTDWVQGIGGAAQAWNSISERFKALEDLIKEVNTKLYWAGFKCGSESKLKGILLDFVKEVSQDNGQDCPNCGEWTPTFFSPKANKVLREIEEEKKRLDKEWGDGHK